MKVVKSTSKNENALPIKLKVVLENMPYPITRKLLVPGDINMMQLHFVLQEAMGWEFAHLFQFSDKQRRATIIASIPPEDDFFLTEDELKADLVSLNTEFYLRREAKPFWYWYDFGDDWWHKITFQKLTKKDKEDYQGYPICTEAVGACPPEDVGGSWGFAVFLDAIQDKKHPEYNGYREWYGLEADEKYTMEFTELEEVNKSLKELYNSPEWRTTTESYFPDF